MSDTPGTPLNIIFDLNLAFYDNQTSIEIETLFETFFELLP